MTIGIGTGSAAGFNGNGESGPGDGAALVLLTDESVEPRCLQGRTARHRGG